MSALAVESDLTAAQFREISRTVYEIAGIQLREGKEGLVRSRLAKRMRQLGLPGFEAYLERVRRDDRELAEMVDLLTTNKTSFFRESAHFDFLRERLLPSLGPGPVRIWSAGCSSGEEPYTLAMVLRDTIADVDRRDDRRPPVCHLRRLSWTRPSHGFRNRPHGSHIERGITLTPSNSAWAFLGRSPPRKV